MHLECRKQRAAGAGDDGRQHKRPVSWLYILDNVVLGDPPIRNAGRKMASKTSLTGRCGIAKAMTDEYLVAEQRTKKIQNEVEEEDEASF